MQNANFFALTSFLLNFSPCRLNDEPWSDRPPISRGRARESSIGWICALSIELTAAIVMLDEEYEGDDDAVHCTMGRIGSHKVVLGCLPAGQIGTNSAAVVATAMRSKLSYSVCPCGGNRSGCS